MDMREKMVLVIRTLQLRGRAGARDIACRAAMTNEETIATLLELEKRKKVDQANGFWWLAVDLGEEPRRKRK
ncbi:hypothetical protein [Enterobacter kobei]|uniref:hypothetical protein n=1 Tax=Enterobacter kobei TaxID=208224 RepID=UPI00079CC0CD|nr:hypothetical protein [Enterobacter kobei]SAF45827.1 Uncharacterised protein [Enterobacter kobei]